MIKKQLLNLLDTFSEISLDALNSSAKFMERIDTKYVVPLETLEKFLEKIKDDYCILNIDKKHVFSYDNIYMDTQDFLFYHQHENKENNRIKIRSRRYKDSDLVYFEFKQKDGKIIRKLRYKQHKNEHGTMTEKAHKFLEEVTQKLHIPFTKKLIKPIIGTQYNRITLCSKKNDERITIDMNISFSNLKKKDEVLYIPDVVIIESKSAHEDCASNKIMQKLGIQKAKGCSKYCMGMYYFNYGKTHKSVKKTLKSITNIYIKQKTLLPSSKKSLIKNK